MQKRTADSTITVPIPLHDELRRGTLLNIIRQSGLPRTPFEQPDTLRARFTGTPT